MAVKIMAYQADLAVIAAIATLRQIPESLLRSEQEVEPGKVIATIGQIADLADSTDGENTRHIALLSYLRWLETAADGLRGVSCAERDRLVNIARRQSEDGAVDHAVEYDLQVEMQRLAVLRSVIAAAKAGCQTITTNIDTVRAERLAKVGAAVTIARAYTF